MLNITLCSCGLRVVCSSFDIIILCLYSFDKDVIKYSHRFVFSDRVLIKSFLRIYVSYEYTLISINQFTSCE